MWKSRSGNWASGSEISSVRLPRRRSASSMTSKRVKESM